MSVLHCTEGQQIRSYSAEEAFKKENYTENKGRLENPLWSDYELLVILAAFHGDGLRMSSCPEAIAGAEERRTGVQEPYHSQTPGDNTGVRWAVMYLNPSAPIYCFL